MKHLQRLLDDVLSGRRIIADNQTFKLLRRFAPDKEGELRCLEAEAMSRQCVEQASPTRKGERGSASNSLPLTRDDLHAILEHRRITTVDEVEWLLAHGNDLRISSTEKVELRQMASRLRADQHCPGARNGDRTDEFIAQVLGTFRTPFGDLSREEVTRLESIRVRAVRAIQDCDQHHKENCRCWADARTQLSELRRSGDKTPAGAAALAVWNSIEDVTRNRHLESPNTEQTEGPPGIIYNWRYYKTPSNQ